MVNDLTGPAAVRFWVADAGIDKTPFARGVAMIFVTERPGEGVGVDMMLSYLGWRIDFVFVDRNCCWLRESSTQSEDTTFGTNLPGGDLARCYSMT